MSGINIVANSDFINIAATRARDLQAAASLLDLHADGVKEDTPCIPRPTTRNQARLDGVSMRATASSRQGEQEISLRTSSRSNADVVPAVPEGKCHTENASQRQSPSNQRERTRRGSRESADEGGPRTTEKHQAPR